MILSHNDVIFPCSVPGAFRQFLSKAADAEGEGIEDNEKVDEEGDIR